MMMIGKYEVDDDDVAIVKKTLQEKGVRTVTWAFLSTTPAYSSYVDCLL